MPWPWEPWELWPGKSSLKFNPNRLGFLEHLEELRRRLILFVAVTAFFSGAAYFFSKPLLDFLILPLTRLNETELYFQTPYEAFLAHLKVSLLAGLLAASPVFFSQLWLFVAPGLYREERRVFLPLVLASIFLFLAGAGFAYGLVVPLTLQFLLSFQTDSLRPLLGIGPYFSFLIGMVFLCGILFEMPVVVLGLVRGGVVGPGALRRARKGVIVFLLLLTAILTPSPDPVGQIVLALPLYLIYEGCIAVARFVEKK